MDFNDFKGDSVMDDLDRKILSLLVQNARMPVKEIAEQVSLTSPAVSSRIHKMETDGIINGYTVLLNRPADQVYVDAPDQSFGRPLPPGGAAGAFAEQPGRCCSATTLQAPTPF